MSNIGVILARSGSKGLVNKNTLKINDRTLIEIAVQTALESKNLDQVVFSTDSHSYASLARNAGATVPFIRPANLSDDTASSWCVVKHAVEFLRAHTQLVPTNVVLLQPTTPLRTVDHIDRTLDLLSSDHFEAAMTIREVQYPVEWMFWLDDNGRPKPVLPDAEVATRRQDTRKAYQPAGTAYAVTYSRLFSEKPMSRNRLGYVEVPFNESINIDTLEDYYLARTIGEQQYA